jgi:hypothetical protein
MLSDFVFQTKWMVADKRWDSTGLLIHIAITVVIALALTGNIVVVALIGITHYGIDIAKTELTSRYRGKSFVLFIADQFAHLFIIGLVWAWDLGKLEEILVMVKYFITSYKITLILLAYVFCIWPAAFIVRFAVQSLLNDTIQSNEQKERIENGGKWIGQFERVIILTFVLLSEYEAIGFLITGKSIIRFADREHMKSEYVLAGTMLSYALAIAAGALVNWVL